MSSLGHHFITGEGGQRSASPSHEHLKDTGGTNDRGLASLARPLFLTTCIAAPMLECGYITGEGVLLSRRQRHCASRSLVFPYLLVDDTSALGSSSLVAQYFSHAAFTEGKHTQIALLDLPLMNET